MVDYKDRNVRDALSSIKQYNEYCIDSRLNLVGEGCIEDQSTFIFDLS
jgi:hypothetical protein